MSEGKLCDAGDCRNYAEVKVYPTPEVKDYENLKEGVDVCSPCGGDLVDGDPEESQNHGRWTLEEPE